ncbi:MAG: SRPBCC family protein [bacterium]|nr:SRPBCC family protein [bacterium]
MPRIDSEILIRRSPEDVFDLAQDYGLRLEWDPFLSAMRFLDGAAEAAVGVRVWVRAKNGMAMTVRYIALNRPKSVAMQMEDGDSLLFAKFSGTWKFEAAQSDDSTRVTFVYSFEPRFAQFLLNPIISRVFQRDIRKRLAGLKHHAENTNIIQRMHAANREPSACG